MDPPKNPCRACRLRAAAWDTALASRISAASYLHIGKTRLGEIERAEVMPHREEVARMARLYIAPELLDWCCDYCIIMKERKIYGK